MDRSRFFASLRARTSGVFGSSLSQKQVDGLTLILDTAQSRGAKLPALAYLLSTVYHETAHTMQPISEYGKRSYFNKYEPTTKIGKALGNTKAGDGYLFRGRGYVQITGRRNYAFASEKLGVDFVGHPDRVMEPRLAVAILFDGMDEGWFTGKKLTNYISDGKADYVNARRIINGTDKANLIAGYAKAFEKALRDAGYVGQAPKPTPVPPAPQPPVDDPVVSVPPAPKPEAQGFWTALFSLLGKIFARKT